MSNRTPPNRRVKTADTVFGIIEAIQKSDGGNVTDIAKTLDLSPSTVHSHLTTLEYLGYVVKENETYDIGLKFLNHGTYAKERYSLVQIASPALDHLAEETSESVCLGVEEHGRLIIIQKAKGERAIRTYNRVGNPIPMHCSSSGKAILGHLPRSRVNEVLDRHGMERRTENTIVDRDELFTELDSIRKQEVAFNDEESAEGVRAVGSAITVDGEVAGAIGIPAPKHRFGPTRFKETVPELLLGATNEIELKLRHGVETQGRGNP